jgi:hypothetical protein
MPNPKIAVLGDLHCGHINAIAPPRHQQSEDSQGCFKILQSFGKRHGPFDYVFLMGDMIDGKGGKNAGVELITTDCSKQADIAIQVLETLPVTKNAKWFAAAGTPYHGGVSEDFERLVASSFGATYSAVTYADVGGYRFRLRHKLNRAMNNLRKQIDLHLQRVGGHRERLVDMLLFGHLHEHAVHHENHGGKRITAVSCPTLQGQTDFGSRQCDGDVDIGCLAIDVTKAGLNITSHVVPLSEDTWGYAKSQGMIA